MYKIGEKKYQKQYYKDNKHLYIKRYKKYCEDEEFLKKKKAYNEQYYIKNKEKRKQEHLKNRDKVLKRMKQYGQGSQERKERYRQSEAYRKYDRKHSSTRRGLGHFALNKHFKNSEAHHISENLIIYIPKEIHQNIRHNIWTWKNMEKINKLAINFL